MKSNRIGTFSQLAATLAIALPVVGFLSNLINLSINNIKGPTVEVALGDSVGSLAFIGGQTLLLAVVSGAFVIYFSRRQYKFTQRGDGSVVVSLSGSSARTRKGAVIKLAISFLLLGLAAMFAASYVTILSGMLIGYASAEIYDRKQRKKSTPLVYADLLPLIAFLCLASLLVSFLAPSTEYLTAKITTQHGSTVPSKQYLLLSNHSNYLYVLACDNPRQLTAISQSEISKIDFTGVSQPSRPSLWHTLHGAEYNYRIKTDC